MKKNVIKKSGGWATIISIASGIVNVILSLFKSNPVGAAEVAEPFPWLMTLLIMLGVFVGVFIVLLIYYSIIKKQVEEIPNP